MGRRLLKTGRAGFYTVVSDLGKKQDQTITGIMHTKQVHKEGYECFFEHSLVYLAITGKITWDKLLDGMEMVVNMQGLHDDTGKRKPLLVVDGQGVGDVITDFARQRQIRVVPIVSVAGYTERFNKEEGSYYVAKSILAQTLVRNAESGVLKIAKGLAHEEEIRKQLKKYTAKYKKSAIMTYENAKESDHDDIVSMLTLGNYFLTTRYKSVLLRNDKRPLPMKQESHRRRFVGRRR